MLNYFKYNFINSYLYGKNIKKNIPVCIYPARYIFNIADKYKKTNRFLSQIGKNDEKGFSMLELILYAAIVSILIAVAVPKYDSAIAAANTAKIQSDLQTLNSGLAMYYTEKGEYPSTINDLSKYVKDVGKVVPPNGKMKVNNTEVDIEATAYTIDSTNGEVKIGTYVLSDFMMSSINKTTISTNS